MKCSSTALIFNALQSYLDLPSRIVLLTHDCANLKTMESRVKMKGVHYTGPDCLHTNYTFCIFRVAIYLGTYKAVPSDSLCVISQVEHKY